MASDQTPSLDRGFRLFFLAFALVASLVTLFMHLKVDLWACARCSLVDDQPVSPFLAWAGPVLVGSLIFASVRAWRHTATTLAIASTVSLGLVVFMVSRRAICPACVLVHTGIVAAALTLLPRGFLAGAAVFICTLVFGGTGGWEKLSSAQGVAVFRPRSFENEPDANTVIVFSDPECPRCRVLEERISRATDIRVLHRWVPLAHSRYRSIRVAAVVESASLRDPALGTKLRDAILSETGPYTDEVILKAASRINLDQDVRNWLDNPEEKALAALEDDRTTAEELGVTSLPALAAVSAAAPDGSRTLRTLRAELIRQ